MHLECWAAAKASKVPNACWQYIRDFTTEYTADFIAFYPGIPMLKKDIGLFLTEENNSYGWDKLPDIIADPKNIRIPGAGAKFDKISSWFRPSWTWSSPARKPPRQPPKRLPPRWMKNLPAH